MSPLLDTTLVLRAGRGDTIAFSQLVVRHYRRALLVAFGLLGERAAAESVTLEAFAWVQRRIGRIASASAFHTALFRWLLWLARGVPARRQVCQFDAVLLLRDVAGFSYDELAAVMRLRRAEVISRLVLAREKLCSGMQQVVVTAQQKCP